MIEATKHAAKHVAHKTRESAELGARRDLLEDLFHDYHKRRVQVYKMSFVRGVLFGLGSALGGSVVLAIVVWLFLQIPGVGQFIEAAQKLLNQ